jgi:hypothetical protein
MMGPRWLALPLAALTAFATATGCATAPAPRMLSADLHIGSLDDRTSFELDHASRAALDEHGAPPTDEGDDLDDLDDPIDTPKQQRTRRLLYRLGLGAIGFGVLGTVGFGIGGRIVQAQMKNGYEDGDLTRDREDQLSTTGTVMNALTITSAVIGLAGVITAATVYGIDHARCGELRPRRKQCADRDEGSGLTTGAGGGTTGTGAAPSDTSGASDEAAGASEAGGSSEAPSDAGGPGNAPGGTGPAASSVGPSPAPAGEATAPTEGPGPAAPGSSTAGGKPSPGGKRASSPGTKAGQ